MVNARLLVVEDESIVAKDIQHRLRNLGYDVPVVVAYGEKAIEKAGELQPNLVLMDIFLKGEMDGIKAAEEIKRLYDIPVIFLTAFADPNTLQRAKVTEPFGYILKPFEERELLTAIEMALYKHKMERKLKESERWLSVTLKSIGDAIIATDTSGKITFMNQMAENLTGWKMEETTGKELFGIYNIIDEITGDSIENPLGGVVTDGVPGELQDNIMMISRSGNEIAIESNATPIKDEKNNIIGAVLVFRDITERKQTEEALQLTQFSIDHAAETVLWLEQNGRVIYANEAACRSLGYTKAELLRLNVKDIDVNISPDSWSKSWEYLRTSISSNMESVYRSKEGKEFPVDITSNYIIFNGKEYNCAFIRDITERKRTETSLKENNRHLEIISSITTTINKAQNTRDMLDNVLRDVLNLMDIDSGAIYLYDTEDSSEIKLRAAVTRFEKSKIVRYRQSVPGIMILDNTSLFIGEARQFLHEVDVSTMATAAPIIVKGRLIGVIVLLPDKNIGAEDTRELISISSQLGIAIENYRLFKKVQDTSNYLASIINESPDAMLTTDASGLIISFNRSATRLLAYSADEVVGRHVNSLLPPGITLDLSDDKSYIKEFKCKDGSITRLNISTSKIYKEGVRSGLIITLNDLAGIAGLQVVPVTELAVTSTVSAHRFETGIIYLLDKKKRQDYMEIFADQVKHNIQGLCITRQNPKKIREKYGLEKTPIIWLNSGDPVAGESVIKPDNITGLAATIYKFMNEAQDGLVLLDGMEYLMMRSSYETMLKFVHYINDRIMMSNSRAIFCIDSQTIDDRQTHILMSEMTDFEKMKTLVAPEIK